MDLFLEEMLVDIYINIQLYYDAKVTNVEMICVIMDL